MVVVRGNRHLARIEATTAPSPVPHSPVFDVHRVRFDFLLFFFCLFAERAIFSYIPQEFFFIFFFLLLAFSSLLAPCLYGKGLSLSTPYLLFLSEYDSSAAVSPLPTFTTDGCIYAPMAPLCFISYERIIDSLHSYLFLWPLHSHILHPVQAVKSFAIIIPCWTDYPSR